MTSIWMEAPTLQINGNQLQNLFNFLYQHKPLLKEYGAIKIQLDASCKLALKKQRKNIILHPFTEQIVKISKDEPLYIVKEVDRIDEPTQQTSSITDEYEFWSSLSCSNNERYRAGTSVLQDTSFFLRKKTSHSYFNIYRLSEQSLLKSVRSKVTHKPVPSIRRTHGPGAIFPLASAQQHLFPLFYHHEGGAHHWYIIPHRERTRLRTILDKRNSSICLDHGRILICPSMLDEYHIRYHRIIQRPNELVVLSPGTLAQSFAEDASWSESIELALPSRIQDDYANITEPFCQCNISQKVLPKTIDIALFRHELAQQYITSDLNIITTDKSLVLKGS